MLYVFRECSDLSTYYVHQILSPFLPCGIRLILQGKQSLQKWQESFLIILSLVYLSAINKLLPELECFLRETLAGEPLSDNANTQREQFLSKLEGLIKPPQLPPRGAKKVSTATITGDEPAGTQTSNSQSAFADLHPSRDFISKQREISWRQKESEVGSGPPANPAPYASKKRNQEEGKPGQVGGLFGPLFIG